MNQSSEHKRLRRSENRKTRTCVGKDDKFRNLAQNKPGSRICAGGSYAVRYASVNSYHREPMRNGDSPDLHYKLRLFAHNGSRQKMAL